MCQLLLRQKIPPRRRQSIDGEDAEITYFPQARQCPRWVRLRRFPRVPATSGAEGIPDLLWARSEGLGVARSRSGGDAGKMLFIFRLAKPGAGNPHVRFDKQEGETERFRTAQATTPLLDSTVGAFLAPL